MTVNVYNIDGTPFHGPKDRAPSIADAHDINEFFDWMNHLHTGGNIKAIAAAVVMDNDAIIQHFAYNGYVSPAILIGALEVTKERCLRAALIHEEEIDI